MSFFSSFFDLFRRAPHGHKAAVENPATSPPPRSSGGGVALSQSYDAVTNQSFDNHFARLGLQFFKPHELRFLGGQNTYGRAKGKNTLPPRALWPHMEPTAIVADEARRRLGSKLSVISGYRSPAYNKLIGGESQSYHMQFMALDLKPKFGQVKRLYEILVAMRAEGIFQGGIGIYNTFVHVDTRGVNADWDER